MPGNLWPGAYDGLNRRIKSHIDSGAPSNPTGIDSYLRYYYTSSWQILETRQSDTQSAPPENLQPKHQYIWSQRYIDAPVRRDENTGANGLCDDDRLYYVNDANFNVIALLDTVGDAVERYVYFSYDPTLATPTSRWLTSAAIVDRILRANPSGTRKCRSPAGCRPLDRRALREPKKWDVTDGRVENASSGDADLHGTGRRRCAPAREPKAAKP